MVILGIIAVFAISVALYGWVVMLILGAFASIFNAPALAIGYGASCLVGVLLSILTGGTRLSVSN